jgi:STE24 endopeptidase
MPKGLGMYNRVRPTRGLVLLAFFLSSCLVIAQPNTGTGQQAVPAMPSVITVPLEAESSDHFNAEAATQAYLAEIPAGAKAKSDAYFEGGYWLILWDFVVGAVISILLLNWKWSAGMRNLGERVTSWRPVQSMLYWVQYLLITSILSFPLTVHESYIRERKYGLATQTFGPWMVDQIKSFGVGLVIGAVVMMTLFGIVRRLPRTWWIWGAVVSVAFQVITVMIFPVFILPIFNKVTRLDDPKITEPILSMARANGIPAREVYQVDASRQTTRMSANVSGFAHTMRITLNDNLLRRGSPQEIQSVMGHEMGHYVLNHVYKGMMFFLILIVVFFWFLHLSLDWSLKRWGEKWQIRNTGDTAVLPLVLLIASVFFLLVTPFTNTFVRTQEHEADLFGLNASRQPDGFAQAAIHLGEYRKMSPGPWEEKIFYDHPSGQARIHDAMAWKAENLNLMKSNPGYAPLAPRSTR